MPRSNAKSSTRIPNAPLNAAKDISTAPKAKMAPITSSAAIAKNRPSSYESLYNRGVMLRIITNPHIYAITLKIVNKPADIQFIPTQNLVHPSLKAGPVLLLFQKGTGLSNRRHPRHPGPVKRKRNYPVSSSLRQPALAHTSAWQQDSPGSRYTDHPGSACDIPPPRASGYQAPSSTYHPVQASEQATGSINSPSHHLSNSEP